MNPLFATVAVVIALAAGMYAGALMVPQTTITMGCSHEPQVVTKYSNCNDLNLSRASSASINVPAVDQQGAGVVTSLRVDVMPGTGRTLTNIDRIFFWVDTQDSIRTARMVAEKVTEVDLSQYDMVYTIKANASVIEGPSAGAAITIATIAAVQGRRLKENIMISGSIDGTGAIGPVGGIAVKANASRDVGAELLVVPRGQKVFNTMDTMEYCERTGWTQVCQTEQIPRRVDVQNESGIRVEEAGNIEEAIKYFY